MATIGDIGVAAAINIITALIFLIAFAILRLQPVNDRVYFSKWYIKGLRRSPTGSVRKFVNLDYRSYLKFLNWVPDALTMPQSELIDHAGLDSVVYLRIYLLGLKIFVPIFLFTWSILIPVNWTNNTLEQSKETYSQIDKLSISNIPHASPRFWAHVAMAYVVMIWTCFMLKKEYETVANMRFYFLQSEKHRPDQFTVLVKNVPPDDHESVSETVENFFLVNHHHDNYLTHQVVCNANKLAKLVKKKQKKQNWLDYYQIKYSKKPLKRPMMKTGFLGLWGAKVDAIEYHETEIEKLSSQIAEERKDVMNNPKSILPVAFVSFKSRWGAAVCAQTQQARNPTLWLTEWAPEPRDVYWKNLAIPYVSLTVRKVIMGVAFFFLTFFYMIPIAFVQSLANIEGIEKAVPFLKPIINIKLIKSFIQGFLPGIVLKIFLLLLPKILMAAFEQLNTFLNQPANKIPEIIGMAIPMKASFFITYIMVDGWSGTAGDILRLKHLVIYHLKNLFLVKTERDRERAMNPGSIGFNTGEPQIQFYFLIGLVYAVVTPLLIPFILVFFGLAFVVYRHQVINVYNPKYESRAAFWPDVHGRVITALIISQILLMGLLSTKHAAASTPVLLALPVLTIGFHIYCKGRFEPAFVRYPLQEAMNKDTLDRAREPSRNLKGYLENAYVHPVFKDDDEASDDAVIIPTKRQREENHNP